MPVKNKYQHYKLNSQQRKSTVVASFGGVDFSSQRFNVSSSRAINIQNFIYKNGVIQKRNGYEQIYKVEPLAYFSKDFDSGNAVSYNVNGVNFNGIWKFVAEDKQVHIIAHIGCLLYEIKDIDSNGDIKIEPLVLEADKTAGSGLDNNGNAVSGYPLLYKYEDYKSFAFVGANRLWFLGGNKYMCIRFLSDGSLSIYPVANKFVTGYSSDDTFIPTTSYNITYEDSISPNRSLLDYPNKLTMFRKNKLLSGTGKGEKTQETITKYYEYILDAPLTIKSSSDLNKIAIVIVSREENE